MLNITVEIEKSCPLGQMTLQISDAETANKTASGVSELVREKIEAAILEQIRFSYEPSLESRTDSERLK